IAEGKGRQLDAACRAAGVVCRDGRGPTDGRARDQRRVEAERGLHVPFEPEVLSDFHHGDRSFVVRWGSWPDTRTKEECGSRQVASPFGSYLRVGVPAPAPGHSALLAAARSE